jgi:RNA:NAD 2'-phosphotransferase (TPT1/KptA family)
MSAQACEHFLYAPSQAISPTVLHDLKLDQHGSRVPHLSTDTSHDKPVKFPFRVIMEPNAREFREQAVKVESQSGEVTLKDEIPITP